MKLVKITWEDIERNSSWQSEDEAKIVKKVICDTTGWLFKETEGHIKIMATKSHEDNDVSDMAQIPKGAIQKIETLSAKVMKTEWYNGNKPKQTKKRKRRRCAN